MLRYLKGETLEVEDLIGEKAKLVSGLCRRVPAGLWKSRQRDAEK